MPYARLVGEAKYGNTDTNENCGEQANMQTDAALEDDLVGHSMDFRQPKLPLVRSVMTGCLNVKKKCYRATRFVFKLAFGRWSSALVVLLSYIGLTVAFSVIALTGKYHEFRKDISLNSFMVPDIKVSSDFAAFNAAKEQAKGAQLSSLGTFENIFKPASCQGNDLGNSSPNKKQLPLHKKHSREKRDTYVYSSGKDGNYLRQIGWTLDLVYVAKGAEKELNIFTRGRLLAIHDIEMKLMKHLDYKDHCYKWRTLAYLDKSVIPYGNCTPPNSVTGFFFPSKQGIFDGLGETIQPIPDTLEYLQTKKKFFSYVSTDYNAETKTSRILRAQILFGKPVAGVSLTAEAQKAEFKKYLRTYIEPLEKINKKNDKVSVLYGGGDLFDYLVEEALLSDLRLAFISLILIIVLLLILTFSLWLTFMAILSILSSVAVAYFFYRVVFGIKYMGILNGVSLFVIIGIGVDDIFVFINTFRQAVDNKDLGDRIYHTISVAGKATLFTSFTTAAAFAANTLSPIPAIHDFGLFMAILVASCWVSVLFVMSSALSLWNAGIERLESALCRKMLSLIGLRRNERLRLPDDIRQFLSGNTVDNDLEELPDYSPCSSDHLELQSLVDDDDEPMLVIDNESSLTREQSTDSLGFRLQSLLYHFVAVPIIKARVAVLVVYLVLFCTSIFLMTKLKVSTEQPKFFEADSNLQRWLELPDVSLSTQMSMNWVGVMEGHIPPSVPPLARRTTPKSRRSTRVGTPPHRWHTTQKSRVASRATNKASTREPTQVTTNPPVTRHTFFTKRQETTSKPTTNSPLSKQIPERTTSSTPPTWVIDAEPTTKFPWFVTTDINGMVPTDNTSRTTVRPYDPCVNHNCVHGECKVKNGSATCHCWAPYAGELCSVDCPVRTMQGNCCAIPFTYKSEPQYGCLIEGTKKSWCYDRDGKKGYCNTTVENQCEVRTLTPNKTCCTFPFVYKMVQYYYCIPGVNKTMSCGIQRQVSSLSDLLPCNITKHDTTPKLCPKPGSCKVAKKPTDGSTAMVYLVFGIKGIDKNSIDRRHVLKETLGKVMYDDKFIWDMSCNTAKMMKSACKICKKIAANRDLVLQGGADCFPSSVRLSLMKHFPEECQDLPSPHTYQGSGDNKKSHSVLVMKDNSKVEWFAMAFSSTTRKLSSYGAQQKDYMKWDKFVKDVLSESGTPDTLKDGYLTSETWVKMFSGMIVVESAVYGIAVSLVLCLAAIVIFTGHALLFIILFMTILGVLLMVTAIFYLTGWQLGGVEAVSLSILVGTSVDYCFHLVEGYILAGQAVRPSLDAQKSRQWRAKAAMSHIGMSIVSSGITTILAAIPLCLAQIQLFAKFGLIVTINTGISLLYTMTVTMAMLGTFGPAKFRASILACVIGAIVVVVLGGIAVLILYIVSTRGYCIPSPRGTPLFKC